jgi:hypothetical protein
MLYVQYVRLVKENKLIKVHGISSLKIMFTETHSVTPYPKSGSTMDQTAHPHEMGSIHKHLNEPHYSNTLLL